MMWLAQQMSMWLALSFALGFVTSLVLTVRRVTVQRWVEVPPEPVAVPVAAESDGDRVVADEEPDEVAEPESPFPTLEGANDPAPWEQEELWSRPAARAAAASTEGTVRARNRQEPADEWDEAATNWRAWADEAAGRAQAEQNASDGSMDDQDDPWAVDDGWESGAERGSVRASDDELFAGDRGGTPGTSSASDDELFAHARAATPLEDPTPAEDASPFPSPAESWAMGDVASGGVQEGAPWDSAPPADDDASPFPSPADAPHEEAEGQGRDDVPADLPDVFPTVAHDPGPWPGDRADDAWPPPAVSDDDTSQAPEHEGVPLETPASVEVAEEAGDDSARLARYAPWRESWRSTVHGAATASTRTEHAVAPADDAPAAAAPAAEEPAAEEPVEEPAAEERAAEEFAGEGPGVEESAVDAGPASPTPREPVPVMSDTDGDSDAGEAGPQWSGGVGAVQPFRRKRRSELLRERKEGEHHSEPPTSSGSAWTQPAEGPDTPWTPTGAQHETHDSVAADVLVESDDRVSAAPWTDGPVEPGSFDDLQSGVDDFVVERIEDLDAMPEAVTQPWSPARHDDVTPLEAGVEPVAGTVGSEEPVSELEQGPVEVAESPEAGATVPEVSPESREQVTELVLDDELSAGSLVAEDAVAAHAQPESELRVEIEPVAETPVVEESPAAQEQLAEPPQAVTADEAPDSVEDSAPPVEAEDVVELSTASVREAPDSGRHAVGGGMWARSMRRMRRGDKGQDRHRGRRDPHVAPAAPAAAPVGADQSPAADELAPAAEPQAEVVAEDLVPTEPPAHGELEETAAVEPGTAAGAPDDSLGWVGTSVEEEPVEAGQPEVLVPDVEAVSDAVVEPALDQDGSLGWAETSVANEPFEEPEPEPEPEAQASDVGLTWEADDVPIDDEGALEPELYAEDEPAAAVGSDLLADEQAEPSVTSVLDGADDEADDEADDDAGGFDFSNGVPRPYGAGSAYAPADGTIPLGYAIKGQNSTMLFYPRNARFYTRVSADVYFDTEESAEQAGFIRFDRRSSTAHVSLRRENLS